MDKEIKITKEYQQALDYIEQNQEGFAFITGKAGTGKSTFLQVLKEKTEKKFACVAPTGIAALNIKGQTIHSFFSFGIKLNLRGIETHNHEVAANLANIDVLIIDEISMVRADLLDRIDAKMRACLENDKPFGGKLIGAIGDLFQLPPVVPSQEKEYFYDKYTTPFFFGSNVFSGMEIFYIEFKDIFRQDDQRFISLLNSIRIAQIAESTINAINQKIHIGNIPDEFEGITLCTTNSSASDINLKKLEEIDEKVEMFQARIYGDVRENMFPNDMIVKLKKGAKVVFIKNDVDGTYRNGETGVIIDISPKTRIIKVQKSDGLVVRVEKAEWEFYKYSNGEAQPTGRFTQIPLRLGWAITIHKSQGMSLEDEVIIDTGRGCFAEGQFYVAMSRVVDPKKVKMKNPLKSSDIRASRDVLSYIKTLEECLN